MPTLVPGNLESNDLNAVSHYLKDPPRVPVIVSEDSLRNQDANQECRDLDLHDDN